jgi:hypothetical protein
VFKRHVLKADAMAGMVQMLEPAMLIGLGLVAVWTDVRFPSLRPRSIVWAVVQIAVSCGVFIFVPFVLAALLRVEPSRELAPLFALALLIPTLTYVMLSWIWLLARIYHDLGNKPRGGHPVSGKS